MIKSNLVNEVYLAHESNYTKGRNGYKVCKITPHIMAGVLSAKQCCVNIFGNPNRNASSNYCIGNNGDIALCVSEDDRAWTSGNRVNDYQAITIEISNCEVGGEWRISDSAWNSLVELCTDICKRYGFRLEYDGTPNGSLTRHNMFASTTCPGPYLQNKLPELANIVNSRLDIKEKPKQEPVQTSLLHNVGDVVTINGVYVSSDSTNKLVPAVKQGTITKIVNGSRNPYLLNNGNVGWVNDECIVGNSQPVVQDTGIKVGDKVRVKQGAKSYKGIALASFIYTNVYDVIEVRGDRAVIGKGNAVTTDIHVSNLYK